MAFDAIGEGRTRRPVRCVIYTRHSVGSSDELSSCAVQREACAVFAASQGWIVENRCTGQFKAAGRALDSRRTAGPKPSCYGDVGPLKGKIRCGRCGRPLSPHSCRRGNKVYRYYRCRATGGGRPPCGYQIAAWDIESMIWQRHSDTPKGEPLDPKRLPLMVGRVVYKPDANRVLVNWQRDRD